MRRGRRWEKGGGGEGVTGLEFVDWGVWGRKFADRRLGSEKWGRGWAARGWGLRVWKVGGGRGGLRVGRRDLGRKVGVEEKGGKGKMGRGCREWEMATAGEG